MKCHCCNAEYKQLYENTFVCPACDHVHRVYLGNEIEYHRNQYRNIERRDIREIDSKGTVTPLFHEKRDHICEKRMSYIKDYLLTTDTYLDIGAGAGTFANKVRPYVSSVECTELDLSLLDECKRLGFKTYQEDFLTLSLGKTYDIVSAWHVLEHVTDIGSFLEKCSKVAKSYCIIEVPTLVSLSGEGRKRDLVDPSIGRYDGHAHYFSKKSFETLASKYFSIIEVREGVQSPALFAIMEPLS